MNQIQPCDLEMAGRFLEDAIKGWPKDSLLEMRLLQQELKPMTCWMLTEEIQRNAQTALQKYGIHKQNGIRNIYYGDGPRRRRGQGTRAGILGISRLRADLDKGFPAEWPDIVPQPTTIVESSPGRFQLYWALTEFCTDIDLAEDLMDRLAALLGGDRSVRDAPHIMRCAGFVNMKYQEMPLAQILKSDTQNSITLELFTALPSPPPSAKSLTRKEPRTNGASLEPPTPDSDVVAAFRATYGQGKRMDPDGLPRLVGFLATHNVPADPGIPWLRKWADTHFVDWDSDRWEIYDVPGMYARFSEGAAESWTPERSARWFSWLAGYVAEPDAPVAPFSQPPSQTTWKADEINLWPTGWENAGPGAETSQAATIPDAPLPETQTPDSWLPESLKDYAGLMPTRAMFGRKRRGERGTLKKGILAKAETLGLTETYWGEIAVKIERCGWCYRKFKCPQAAMNHPGKQPVRPMRCNFFLCPFCAEREIMKHRDRNAARYKKLRYPGCFILTTEPVTEDRLDDVMLMHDRFFDRSRMRLRDQGYFYSGVYGHTVFESLEKNGKYGTAMMHILDIQGQGETITQRRRREKVASGEPGITGNFPYEDNGKFPVIPSSPVENKSEVPQPPVGAEYLAIRAAGLRLFLKDWDQFCQRTMGIRGLVTEARNLTPEAALDWFYDGVAYPAWETEENGMPSEEAIWLAFDVLGTKKHRIQSFGNLRLKELLKKGPKPVDACDICLSPDTVDTKEILTLENLKTVPGGELGAGALYWEDGPPPLQERLSEEEKTNRAERRRANKEEVKRLRMENDAAFEAKQAALREKVRQKRTENRDGQPRNDKKNNYTGPRFAESPEGVDG